jgi:hypothetical protein
MFSSFLLVDAVLKFAEPVTTQGPLRPSFDA